MDKINLNDPRYTVLGNPNEVDIDTFISEKNKPKSKKNRNRNKIKSMRKRN